MIVCALAISAAIPSFSQTSNDSYSTEPPVSGPTEAARDAAESGAPKREPRTSPLDSTRVDTPEAERVAASSRPPQRNATGTASTRERQRAIDAALLRKRFARLVDARLAAALADAVELSLDPLTVDRGQLLRASLAGHLRASYWLLQHPELLLGSEAAVAYRSASFSPGAPERALRLALYRRLVVQAPSADVLVAFDVLARMRSDLRAGWLDASAAVSALMDIEVAYPDSALGRRARLARANVLATSGRGVAYLEGLAARLYASLINDPNMDIAQAAADALWRIQNLRVGCQAPTLCGNDAVGNEHCLRDLVGRIVLVRFWSQHDESSEAALLQDAFLDQHFWNHSVSILGVNRDPDRAQYLLRKEQMGVPGIQIYEGPQSEDLLPEIRDRRAGRPLVYDAWREAQSGSIYLIDGAGVIRAVDPPLERLTELIQGLVDEDYIERRRRAF